MTLLEAALAYAEAGWYVLPTDPADIKSPGSVVGSKWHEKSSREPKRIRRWWKANPDYGIALHCGRSGAGAFDYDQDNINAVRVMGRDDLADALLSAEAVQGTRHNGDRGHYIFLLPDDGKEYGNSAGAFTAVGDFRGKNGVIIAAPTPHPDAENKGGEYRQLKTGPVGPMPDVLRECLSEAGESADPLTDAELDAFLDAHTGGGCGRENCPHKIDGPIAKYNANVDAGASRYQTLVAIAPWALSEAVAGCYAARDVVEAMRSAYNGRFGPDERERLQRVPGEFLRVMKWAAAQAVPARSHRNDKPEVKRSQATLLVDLALERYKLGISTDGKPFGYSPTAPHVALDLRGGKLGLRQTLARDYFQRYDAAATTAAIASACGVLEGMAREQPPTPLHLRVAGDDKAIHVDMADEHNRVIEICGGSWRIVHKSPYMFRRTELTRALPEPSREGNLSKLWPYLNIRAEDKPLLVAVMVDALINPGTAKPVVGFTGEHGTAKSASATRFVSLIDPSDVPLHSPPKDLEHWLSASAGSWAVGLDNLSSIPDWLSDAFCRASTGTGSVKRQLYTDDGLAVLRFRRCVVFNGIDVGGMRGDLADRLISFDLQRITDDKRKTDAELERAWSEAYPDIFGGLLDIAAEVHDMLPGLGGAELPRMADFARVLICVDKIAGTDGMERYRDRLSRAMAESAVSDSFIEFLIDAKYDTTDAGKSAGEVLLEANRRRPAMAAPQDWPRSPKAVTARLKRNAPALRSMGWSVSNDGGNNKSGTTKWYVQPPDNGDGGESGGESEDT
ncbi:bifunctional DNA primase/polymerase [Mycobacterium persicum]|uniref:bifunctional DNA primase/polymerase n=1 Tax=Mycobacterium persicum TaxID=1487726 RepID=UPI001301B29E|nr:bifunctional DNA primase/polymerase [Mycobacterium persicum]